MSHTCLSPVFSSVTRLLAVSESIAKVPHRHVTKWVNHSSILFFSEATTIMAEAIAKIQTRRSSMECAVLHSHKSVCKELKVFNRALSSERLPLHAISFITINNVTGSSNTERVLHCLRRLRREPAFARTWSTLYNSSELP